VGSKRQAEEAEKKINADIVAGRWGIWEKERIGFRELSEKYLEHAQVNKSPKTYKVDKYLISAHFNKFFGDISISLIDKRMIDEYKAMRSKQAVAKTVNNELNLLSAMFRMAVRWEFIDKNPMSDVDKMKIPKTNPRYLNQPEIESLIESAKGFYIDALIVTALHTGMRKSELFNLTWNDIDFDNRLITIQSKDDWNTKNYKPRTMTMTDILCETLREHRHFKRELGEASEYVFTYRGHKIVDNIKKTLERVVKEAGLQGVTLHTLRHTFASQLAMAGVSLMDIKELMGHQSYETTLRYAHLAEGHVGKQTNKLPYGKAKEPLRIIEAKTA
jgi:integrase